MTSEHRGLLGLSIGAGCILYGVHLIYFPLALILFGGFITWLGVLAYDMHFDEQKARAREEARQAEIQKLNFPWRVQVNSPDVELSYMIDRDLEVRGPGGLRSYWSKTGLKAGSDGLVSISYEPEQKTIVWRTFKNGQETGSSAWTPTSVLRDAAPL